MTREHADKASFIGPSVNQTMIMHFYRVKNLEGYIL
ncbi:hypothetical protein Bmeg_05301 [Bacillus megaterium]|nr:hypothetical protein [Priestia megaterium]